MVQIFTVTGITEAVAHTLQAEFPFVWVRGQVTNLARPGSGHIYFSLKDHNASLAVVWFKSNQQGTMPSSGERVDPLTGEVLSGRGLVLQEGMDILVAGRIQVYAPRGTYQLVAELVQEQGVGDLHLAFEALKQKLAGQGYFDPGRKQTLPKHVRRVAVVTAPGGAAIRDFVKIARSRGLGGQIRVYPSLVQGDKAPESIIHAMDRVVADDWADILVLIRGGGSIEDLWAFNDESVATAIFSSPLPVVCGVGHEVDTTIADLVADVRAATPTHAAQIIWPERETMMQGLDELSIRLSRAMNQLISGFEARLGHQEKGLDWLSPETRINRIMDQVNHAILGLKQAGTQWMARKSDLLIREATRLCTALGPGFWRMHEHSLLTQGDRLALHGQGFVEAKMAQTRVVQTRLQGLDPHAPLQRGYCLVRKEDGSFVRDQGEVAPDELVEILPARGRIVARVVDHQPAKKG
ncbi:exodeoxyribonuclease VII large subunit [Desulfoplanes formicivorans]|uniref:Exodeoxyribonuclease 7 large subunit n=1 Tax=Desulfoplanes formicivorans TaxID=1592317 RepID=A0A194ADC0_9BACT|nr:exodeoxyribonuclease VII large subunit [Desulfoplanes formicivorans]GAU08087.1 exodeoxyribonuclease VII large subunit [Desulfoplanes formicivorans]